MRVLHCCSDLRASLGENSLRLLGLLLCAVQLGQFLLVEPLRRCDGGPQRVHHGLGDSHLVSVYLLVLLALLALQRSLVPVLLQGAGARLIVCERGGGRTGGLASRL
eukprot:910147-Prymnesium_polylepis.1